MTAATLIDCPTLTREQRVALALADVAGLVRDVKLIEGDTPAVPGVGLRLRRNSRKSLDTVNAAMTHAGLRFAGCTDAFGYRWLPAETAEARALPVRTAQEGSDEAKRLKTMPKNGHLTAYALDCLFQVGAPPTFWAPNDAEASRYALRADAWGVDGYPVALVKLA
jgi:hypothetical protein